ncbi:MAG: GTP-binding protein [Eubacteriales bacterium]|nr:GTP-binding protein [Eubacteriales bacterium]MDY2982745.1 CobW family GTP-binding protein [Eubacteriales bacterium]
MTKIDIFSGFLGAGKTTLIRKLIKEAFAGEKLVLIENEFGEIGVDGAFMQDAGIEVTEMNSGCICCSLVGDFGKALKKVLETYAPDRILIEPSGVGKLSDVIKAVEKVDSRDLVLNSFTTVVDAKKAKIYMKNFGEFFNNQVENANSIILSRTAGMDPAKLSAAIVLLREKNPEATLITTPWEELDGKTILAAMEKRSTLEAALRELEQEAETHEEHDHCCHHHDHEEEECSDPDCACHHHHDHEEEECDDPDCACHHHHHHHGHDADEVFVSWGAETPRKFTEEELRHILAQLESGEYGTVLRSKGLVDAADGQWLYFDYVPGEPDIRRGAPGVTGRICVIGSQLKEDNLQALFNV